MKWERDIRQASEGMVAPGISQSCMGRRIQVKMDGIYLCTFNGFPDPDYGYSPDSGDYIDLHAWTFQGEEAHDSSTSNGVTFPGASIGTHFHLATDQVIMTSIDTNISRWKATIGVHWVCPYIPPSCERSTGSGSVIRTP